MLLSVSVTMILVAFWQRSECRPCPKLDSRGTIHTFLDSELCRLLFGVCCEYEGLEIRRSPPPPFEKENLDFDDEGVEADIGVFDIGVIGAADFGVSDIDD